jgi:hypothetical protein
LAGLSLAVPNLVPVPILHDADSPIRQLFATSDEANLPTWFNVVVLAHAASASLIVGFMTRRAPGWPALTWSALAVLLALLSLDDLASLHERLEDIGRRLGGGEGALHFAWVIPGLVIGAAVVAAVVVVALRLPGRARRYLVAGIGVLIGTALGFELVTGYVLDRSGQGRPFAVLVTLEELLEAVGAVLLLCAPLATIHVGRRDDGWHARLQPSPADGTGSARRGS